MAWIPLLLASWIAFDVVVVAAVLAVARRKRKRELSPIATPRPQALRVVERFAVRGLRSMSSAGVTPLR